MMQNNDHIFSQHLKNFKDYRIVNSYLNQSYDSLAPLHGFSNFDKHQDEGNIDCMNVKISLFYFIYENQRKHSLFIF